MIFYLSLSLSLSLPLSATLLRRQSESPEAMGPGREREREQARGLARFVAGAALLASGVLLAGPGGGGRGGGGGGAPLHPDPLTACSGCAAVARLASVRPHGLDGGAGGGLCADPVIESLRRTVGWDGLGFFEVDPVPRIRGRIDPTFSSLCQALLTAYRPGLTAVSEGTTDPGSFCQQAGACLGAPSPVARALYALQAMHRDPLLALRLTPFLLLFAFLPSVLRSFFRGPSQEVPACVKHKDS